MIKTFFLLAVISCNLGAAEIGVVDVTLVDTRLQEVDGKTCIVGGMMFVITQGDPISRIDRELVLREVSSRAQALVLTQKGWVSAELRALGVQRGGEALLVSPQMEYVSLKELSGTHRVTLELIWRDQGEDDVLERLIVGAALSVPVIGGGGEGRAVAVRMTVDVPLARENQGQ